MFNLVQNIISRYHIMCEVVENHLDYDVLIVLGTNSETIFGPPKNKYASFILILTNPSDCGVVSS